MGYYTRFHLKWAAQEDYRPEPRCEHRGKAGAKFCATCGMEVGFRSLAERMAEEITASEHDEDMRGLSKRIPEVLFTLHGEGEEAGDIWNKYFLNGKMQVAKARIEFDEFDPKKLR